MRSISLLLTAALFICLASCASNSYNVKLAQVQALCERGDFEQAKTGIKRLIELFPDESQPYYLLGTIYSKEGDYASCLTNFDRAERLGIKATHTFYYEKGIALYNMGNFDEAEKSFRRSIGITSSPEAHRYLGLLRYQAGDYTEAASSLKEALSKFPADVNLLSCLGISLYRGGNGIESLEIFKRALALAPENDNLLFHTAYLLMLDGQPGEAAVHFGKISPVSPIGANLRIDKR